MKKISILGFQIRYFIHKGSIGYLHILLSFTHLLSETAIEVERRIENSRLKWDCRRVSKKLNSMYK